MIICCNRVWVIIGLFFGFMVVMGRVIFGYLRLFKFFVFVIF